MKTTTLALAVLLLSPSAPAVAQETVDVVGQLLAFIEDPANDDKTYKDLRQKAESLTAEANSAAEADAASMRAVTTEQALQDATDVAAAAPATTAAPDGFSTRVNDSLTNFLPLFGFAVNSISTGDDEKSVSVIYNPIPIGRNGVLSFSATIAEPEASPKLLEQVEQPAQAAETQAIASMLDDFSDLTFSGTYGYQRSDLGKVWADGAHLWGRHPMLYQNLASELMTSVWAEAFGARSVATVVASGDFEVEIADKIRDIEDDDVNNATIAQLRAAFTPEELADRLPVVVDDAVSGREFFEVLDENKLSHFGAMVANQPQFTITGAHRNRDPLIGADETVVTAKLEIGSANLNRAMSYYKKTKDAKKKLGETYTLPEAYRWAIDELNVQAQNRTSVSVTYKERSAWDASYPYKLQISDPMGGEPTEVEKVAALSNPSGSDWCFKASWSRTFRRSTGSIKSRGLVQEAAKLGAATGVSELAGLAEAELDVPARLDVSIEYIDVDGDDPLMRDRGIARLSYALPLPGGLSLPFTLTYANHSEFLGEQDDVLSTHIGLTYTLPWK